jgi:hypothetical protein
MLCQFIIINIINNNSLNIKPLFGYSKLYYTFVPINKEKRKKKGEKREKIFFLYDSAINIRIISYLLTKKEKKGKEKGKKGKNLFCFVCMILLLIYKNVHVFMLGN